MLFSGRKLVRWRQGKCASALGGFDPYVSHRNASGKADSGRFWQMPRKWQIRWSVQKLSNSGRLVAGQIYKHIETPSQFLCLVRQMVSRHTWWWAFPAIGGGACLWLCLFSPIQSMFSVEGLYVCEYPQLCGSCAWCWRRDRVCELIPHQGSRFGNVLIQKDNETGAATDAWNDCNDWGGLLLWAGHFLAGTGWVLPMLHLWQIARLGLSTIGEPVQQWRIRGRIADANQDSKI